MEIHKTSYNPKPKDFCYCGSGKKYKNCCMELDKEFKQGFKRRAANAPNIK